MTSRLSPLRFYEPVPLEKDPVTGVKEIGYDIAPDWDQSPPGTDSQTVINQKLVSVTPLSLDLTSRVDLDRLRRTARAIPNIPLLVLLRIVTNLKHPGFEKLHHQIMAFSCQLFPSRCKYTVLDLP